jgi:hypothetical protein
MSAKFPQVLVDDLGAPKVQLEIRVLVWKSCQFLRELGGIGGRRGDDQEAPGVEGPSATSECGHRGAEVAGPEHLVLLALHDHVGPFGVSPRQVDSMLLLARYPV